MTIIVSRGGKPEKIKKSDFDNEDFLQQFIYNNPDTIPLDELKKQIRLLILKREFPTNTGPIDALGIDGDGEIYIVETKLYRNPDKRTVVAQMLDYGASLWTTYKDSTDFVSILDAEINAKFQKSLNQLIKEFFAIDDEGGKVILASIRHNLATAHFKFVVLMDQLDDRLKDLVTFINENSKFAIFAVEIEYYKHHDYEIMIPKLYGAETSRPPIAARRKWDEKSFFDEAQKSLEERPEQIATIKKFHEFFRNRADAIEWGGGNKYGTLNPRFYNVSKRLFAQVTSDGDVWVYFAYLNDSQNAVNFRNILRGNLEKIKGLDVSPDKNIIMIGAVKATELFDEIVQAFGNSLDSL